VSTQAEGAAQNIVLERLCSALREPAIIRRYSSTLEKRNLGTHMRAKQPNLKLTLSLLGCAFSQLRF